MCVRVCVCVWGVSVVCTYVCGGRVCVCGTCVTEKVSDLVGCRSSGSGVWDVCV